MTSGQHTSLNSGLSVFFLVCVLFFAFFPISGFRHLFIDIFTEFKEFGFIFRTDLI